jgi:biotin transporter BioY
MRKFYLMGFIWLAAAFALFDELYGGFRMQSFAFLGVIPAVLIIGIPWVRRERRSSDFATEFYLMGFIWLAVAFGLNGERFPRGLEMMPFVFLGVIPAALIIGIPWVRRERRPSDSNPGRTDKS